MSFGALVHQQERIWAEPVLQLEQVGKNHQHHGYSSQLSGLGLGTVSAHATEAPWPVFYWSWVVLAHGS